MRNLIKQLLLRFLQKKIARGTFSVPKTKYRKPKKRKGGLKHLLKKFFD